MSIATPETNRRLALWAQLFASQVAGRILEHRVHGMWVRDELVPHAAATDSPDDWRLGMIAIAGPPAWWMREHRLRLKESTPRAAVDGDLVPWDIMVGGEWQPDYHRAPVRIKASGGTNPRWILEYVDHPAT